MELIDALSSNTSAHSVVELSLDPLHAEIIAASHGLLMNFIGQQM